ncbi:MAG: hypothetical protein AAF555_02240 [Verrucomicrobiota bacterium]
MNPKFSGLILVGLLAAVIAYVVMEIQDHYTVAKQEAADAKNELELAQNAKLIAAKGLTNLEKSTDSLREYLKRWRVYFEEGVSEQEAEQLITDKVRQSGVVVLSQSSRELTNKEGLAIPRHMRFSLILEDDYVKTLNWIGSLEQEFPTARVNRCQISKGQQGNDIKVILELDLPIIDEEQFNAGGTSIT